jgi:hypothetical protein
MLIMRGEMGLRFKLIAFQCRERIIYRPAHCQVMPLDFHNKTPTEKTLLILGLICLILGLALTDTIFLTASAVLLIIAYAMPPKK